METQVQHMKKQSIESGIKTTPHRPKTLQNAYNTYNIHLYKFNENVKQHQIPKKIYT